jgi:hypothetical protein
VKPFLLLSAFLFVLSSAFAQDVDLRGQDHVPLFDCGIFSARRDREACQDLRRTRAFDPRQEEAVPCGVFRRREGRQCRQLAERLTFNARAFRCDTSRCERVRRAYDVGHLYRPEIIIDATPEVVQAPNTCGPEAYDRAYRRWDERREELRRRGRDRAILGTVITIGGIILGGSDDRGTRVAGDLLTIGGVFMVQHGLVEMAVADTWYPHLDPVCGGHYIRETRRVVVEERHCTTTRYTEHGWNSSRSYYEVNCENRRYVTYERFAPYEESSYVVTY